MSSNEFVWITCRAAGIAALVLVSASVGVGVSLSGGLLRGRGGDLRATHEALSIAALALIALHATTLLLDSYFHPSVADLLVPFVRDYREPYMGIGIIGGWATVVLGFSYYARRWIGVARWRVLHRATALAWVLSIVHAFGEGSDGGAAWFIAVIGVTVAPPALLILLRGARSGGSRPLVSSRRERS